MTSHEMFDGCLRVYRRGSGRIWQCSARLGGKRFRETTSEEGLAQAEQIAEEWYLGLPGKLRNGEIVPDERISMRLMEGPNIRPGQQLPDQRPDDRRACGSHQGPPGRLRHQRSTPPQAQDNCLS